jgi:SAM-dependent methyltransferase
MRTRVAAPDAATKQASYYDARYATGRYMAGFSDVFAACRHLTVREELAGLDSDVHDVLDYGCGEGRYFPVLTDAFPSAAIVGCDVSHTAVERAKALHPDGTFLPMRDEHVPLGAQSVDLVLSIEVLEHVADVGLATQEIGRVLRPGGVALLTTPCANPWSLEWIVNRVRRGGLQPSRDGYGRFATEEAGHLRRLQSRDLDILLRRAGLEVDHFAFRAHLFTTLVAHPWPRMLLPLRLQVTIAMLDWRLWRTRPNGATMLVVARKP